MGKKKSHHKKQKRKTPIILFVILIIIISFYVLNSKPKNENSSLKEFFSNLKIDSENSLSEKNNCISQARKLVPNKVYLLVSGEQYKLKHIVWLDLHETNNLPENTLCRKGSEYGEDPTDCYFDNSKINYEKAVLDDSGKIIGYNTFYLEELVVSAKHGFSAVIDYEIKGCKFIENIKEEDLVEYF